MLEDLKQFDLGDYTSLINNIKLLSWGNELELECIYAPHNFKLSYKIHFFNCSEIDFSIHSPENSQDLVADIIDFKLEEKELEKTAIIYTDIFELFIIYDSLKIEKLTNLKI